MNSCKEATLFVFAHKRKKKRKRIKAIFVIPQQVLQTDIAEFAFPLAAKSLFCAQMGILRRAHSVSSDRVVRTYLLLDI